MPREPVYFIHLSDTHIGPGRDYRFEDCTTMPPAEDTVDAINSLPRKPDFVIHTGDVVTSPDPSAYALAGEVFSKLQIPIYYVAGNHDDPRNIHAFLPMGTKMDLMDDREVLSYSFDKKGFRFVVLDARTQNESDAHGHLSENQLEFARYHLETSESPLAFFVHFPPVNLDSKWLDREMLLVNGESLHQMLLARREKVRGVFFGHVHRGTQVLRDGILYSSVASTCVQFNAWPDDEEVGFDRVHPPAFNLITLLDSHTIVKEHLVRRR